MGEELRRSWMFVPGHRQKMVDKALGLPQQEKQNARQTIGTALAREGLGSSPARFVRVSSIAYEHITADLAHIVQPGLDGLVLPKVETPQQILLVDAILRAREIEKGITAGKHSLLIAIESPLGLLNADALAPSSPRV